MRVTRERVGVGSGVFEDRLRVGEHGGMDVVGPPEEASGGEGAVVLGEFYAGDRVKGSEESADHFGSNAGEGDEDTAGGIFRWWQK